MLLASFLMFDQSNAQISLPKLISDGMVLQRDVKLTIWGWASSGEKVEIDFLNKKYSSVTDKNGNWSITIPKLKSGGPFDMVIKGKNEIVIKNILIGDVWVCGGQSNMQTNMERIRDLYESEVSSASNEKIRQFIVPQKYDFNQPRKDISGGNWISVSPSTIQNFSGVAYFFAKKLFERYGVPIGLINTAIGGTPAEAWVSEETLKNFPTHLEILNEFKNEKFVNEIISNNEKISREWISNLNKIDLGYASQRDDSLDFFENINNWGEINIPGFWDEQGVGKINGSVWFIKSFAVPKSMLGKELKLYLGRIVDSDSTFINSKFVGSVSYQYPPRKYKIPAGLLHEENNEIVVRVVNNIGRGGFIKDKPYYITDGEQKLDLSGEWKYKVGAIVNPHPPTITVHYKPTGLYNGMVAPLFNYSIKGVIWYQGESNTGKAIEYQSLMPALINDWRKNWKNKNLPFLYVQLPNFMETNSEPVESQWAELRDAQLKTLSVPNTGMAVAIDLGEWNDIHPFNKKDVGERLALAAQKIAYSNKKIVHSGPIYKSMKINDNSVILSFENVGSGLMTKDGKELKYFAIAGEDGKYVWASAKIENNKVIVWNDEVKNPKFVRYAWANNPEGANLYNKEGLPASPFQAGK
ncbi:MAG: sialate O-acetylesterase [Melioribacteraceae bacterium]|nr:sialate O-acetylesterase [Melioribacteraceae bacterium]